mmetsp:Transcript_21544/g.73871  ORF Transcript_21544/g.73871 Transcript_21544/m.73871 type:complete len:284 (+) Transcript_21544:1783-2634(+)
MSFSCTRIGRRIERHAAHGPRPHRGQRVDVQDALGGVRADERRAEPLLQQGAPEEYRRPPGAADGGLAQRGLDDGEAPDREVEERGGHGLQGRERCLLSGLGPHIALRHFLLGLLEQCVEPCAEGAQTLLSGLVAARSRALVLGAACLPKGLQDLGDDLAEPRLDGLRAQALLLGRDGDAAAREGDTEARRRGEPRSSRQAGDFHRTLGEHALCECQQLLTIVLRRRRAKECQQQLPQPRLMAYLHSSVDLLNDGGVQLGDLWRQPLGLILRLRVQHRDLSLP